MKIPLTDQEEWHLAREQAHPRASELLRDDAFWDIGNDYCPLGNDDGWDACDQYLKAHLSTNPIDAIEFLDEYLLAMDLSITPWPPVASNASVASCAHQSVIGVAFAMFVVHGWIATELKELAIQMVEREQSDEALKQWCYPDERLRSLAISCDYLRQMPTQQHSV